MFKMFIFRFHLDTDISCAINRGHGAEETDSFRLINYAVVPTLKMCKLFVL